MLHGLRELSPSPIIFVEYERRRYFNWFVVENERGLARRQSSVSEVDLICRISQGRSLASQTLLQEGGLASETTKSVVPTIVRLRRKITRERFSLGYRIRGHRFVPLFYPSEKRSSPQAVLTFPKLFYNFPNCSTFSLTVLHFPLKCKTTNCLRYHNW